MLTVTPCIAPMCSHLGSSLGSTVSFTVHSMVSLCTPWFHCALHGFTVHSMVSLCTPWFHCALHGFTVHSMVSLCTPWFHGQYVCGVPCLCVFFSFRETTKLFAVGNAAVKSRVTGASVAGHPVFTQYRLVGLVVRHPPREWKIPGSNPACARIFWGSSHTSLPCGLGIE